MTPLQFEAQYEPLWRELEAMLDRLEGTLPPAKGKTKEEIRQSRKEAKALSKVPVDAARMGKLYRLSCEHLALAQARAYPVHLRQRLEQATHRAHRIVYRRHDYGIARFKRLVLADIPQGVRDLRWYLLAATLLFVLPALLVGWASWSDPGFILHLLDADQVRNFDDMYDSGTGAMDKRTAGTDWSMFGHYIQHNIGLGFQCFAGGIFYGLGSIFFLVYNGAHMGTVAGYLTWRGHTENFWSFVITHGAFELTAIVLSGAAGMKLGHALLAPGRRTRLEALKHSAAEGIVVMYGAMGMLVIAAAVEAFWSPAAWVPPQVKYGVGTACWALVFAYLGWQGRPARAGSTHAD